MKNRILIGLVACSTVTFAQQLSKFTLPPVFDSCHFVNYFYDKDKEPVLMAGGVNSNQDLIYKMVTCDRDLKPLSSYAIECKGMGNQELIKLKEDTLYLKEVVVEKEESRLQVKMFDLEGRALGTRTLVTSGVNGIFKHYFRNYIPISVEVSPDDSKMLVYYGGNRGEDREARIQIKVFGRGLKELTSCEVVFPYKDNRILPEQVKLTNEGNILFTAHVFDEEFSKMKSRSALLNRKHKLVLFYYDVMKKNLSEHVMLEFDKERVAFNCRYNPALDRFDFIGLSNEKYDETYPGYNGIYFSSYYPAKGVIETKKVAFDTAFLHAVLGDWGFKKKQLPYDLALDHWTYFKNGDMCLFGHKIYVLETMSPTGAYTMDFTYSLGGRAQWVPQYAETQYMYSHYVTCMILGADGSVKRSAVLPSAYSNYPNYFLEYDEKADQIFVFSHSTTGRKKEDKEYDTYVKSYKRDAMEPNHIYLTSISKEEIQTKTYDCVDFIDNMIWRDPDSNSWYLHLKDVKNPENKRVQVLKFKP